MPYPTRIRVAQWLSCILAVVASAVLAAWWTASGRLPVTGDEPHYLVIAASVVHDFDFDVRNNYEQYEAIHEILSDAPTHVRPAEAGWWPRHMPGLGILLAVPFGLGGAIGARAALPALLIPVLGIAVHRWSRGLLRPADAMVATLGGLACSPLIFGASQLYPDLAGGAAVLALAGWLWGHERRTRLGWCLYWCAAGFLCWLHVKYYGTSAVLAALGIWQLRRDASRFTAATYSVFGVLFLAGPVLFAAFSLPRFGDMLGGRQGAELIPDFARTVEIFLGLHLDQVHGLFFHQPLFLPGLIALGWMIRRRHPLTLSWLVLYASLLVPNALERIPYGGHIAPAGRFGWSATWLWIIPLGIWVADRPARGAGPPAVRLSPVVRLALALGIGFQAALALQWVTVPQRLFNYLFPPDQWQPSLFAPSVMLSLPKFGLHGDIGYPPNIVWTLAALALIAAGFLHPARLRYLPPAAVLVLALFTLPVKDTLERSRTAPRRYEAEHTPAYCTIRPRADTSNGHVCRQDAAAARGPTLAGPFVSLRPGHYRIVVALGGRPGPVSVLVVADRGRTIVAQRRFNVAASVRGSFLTVEFGAERTLQDVEFRVFGFEALEIDYINLIRLTEAGSDSASKPEPPSLPPPPSTGQPEGSRSSPADTRRAAAMI